MANEHNELRNHTNACLSYALGCHVRDITDALQGSPDDNEWVYAIFNSGESLAEYVVNSANSDLRNGLIVCRCGDGRWNSPTIKDLGKVAAMGELFQMLNAQPDMTGRI